MIKVAETKEISADKLLDMIGKILDDELDESGIFRYKDYHIRISSRYRTTNYNKYMREYYRRNRNKFNKNKILAYRKKLSEGLCVRCGKVNDSPNNVKCIECRAKISRR